MRFAIVVLLFLFACIGLSQQPNTAEPIHAVGEEGIKPPQAKIVTHAGFFPRSPQW